MRHRGRVRASVGLSVFLLVVAGATAASAVAPCLRQCDLSANPATDCCAIEPCLAGPCGEFLACRAEAKARFDECIANDDDCAPGPPGRCTVILRGCVQPCQRLFKSDVKRCARQSFGVVTGCTVGDCSLRGPRSRTKAQRACNSCQVSTTTTSTTTSSTTSVAATTTTTASGGSTTTTTTTRPRTTTTLPEIDRCLAACIGQFDSIRTCYDECDDHCEGNLVARRICRQSCRNFACGAIKRRCADETADGTQNPEVDPAYHACCDSKGTCIAVDETPCKVTTTTTSTTTTMIATTTTVTTTTTTTSPQP